MWKQTSSSTSSSSSFLSLWHLGPFSRLVFPLLGFWGEFLWGEVVSSMPTLQPGGPGYLSGISLKMCLAWVALLSVRPLPGWISSSLAHTGSITWLNMPSAQWMYDWAGRQTFVVLKAVSFCSSSHWDWLLCILIAIWVLRTCSKYGTSVTTLWNCGVWGATWTTCSRTLAWHDVSAPIA